MLRGFSATPCPVNDARPQADRGDSTFSVSEDTTANLSFTTDFKASFRNVKPRRPPGRVRKPTVNELGFTIHEDEELQLQLAEKNSRASVAQAPSRPEHYVSFAQASDSSDALATKPALSSRLLKAPRRPSCCVTSQTSLRHASMDDTLPAVPSPKISRPARRGTIYIPSDDTTVPSMYMGIFSPLKNEPRNTDSGYDGPTEEHTGLAMQIARKRMSRRQSGLVGSPKRGPLHATTRPLQATLITEDRLGNGPGKENFPPGYAVRDESLIMKKPRKSIIGTNILGPADGQIACPERPASRLLEPTVSSAARHREGEVKLKPVQKSMWNSAFLIKPTKPTTFNTGAVESKTQNPTASPHFEPKPRVPTRFVVPTVRVEPIDHTFPLIPEGLPETSLYEDNWLGQQEVAITQLINNLFATANPCTEQADAGLLRVRLLEQYNDAGIVLMHKRVQGALLYGALSIPKAVLEDGHRLYSDLGKRKAFVDLWLEIYNHETLKTALEVVVGRVVASSKRSSGPCSPSTSLLRKRRALQTFIETFLIRNEDGQPGPEVVSQAAWSYNRTVLRSLMLIKVLDMSKTTPGLSSSSLFQASSSFKTSSSAVKALIEMTNPGAGDLLRALSHLGYSVSHSQYPLEEYGYDIKNLAVDLRDGVRLTRLVELLLYRFASKHMGHEHNADATTTLLMPTGEILGLTDGPPDWPLSQHLKLPCISRITKMFNVQIALSALQGVKGMELLANGIRAEDIVDGFREKTVKLLWGLTSKWGLEGLVDWEDVKSEIRRLGRAKGHVGYGYGCFEDLGVDDEDDEYLHCKALLKAWAKAAASTRGLTVKNFTTSFTDGRIFGAIVDEYQPYLADDDKGVSKGSLSDRLKSLGCSDQFARLFVIPPGSNAVRHLFDRDFVLASLAFLCSRLLSPSKRARAAVVIQRAWRKQWEKILERRKHRLRVVAEACADAATRRQKDEDANTAILQARNLVRSTADQDGLADSMEKLDFSTLSASEDDIWLSL